MYICVLAATTNIMFCTRVQTLYVCKEYLIMLKVCHSCTAYIKFCSVREALYILCSMYRIYIFLTTMCCIYIAPLAHISRVYSFHIYLPNDVYVYYTVLRFSVLQYTHYSMWKINIARDARPQKLTYVYAQAYNSLPDVPLTLFH